MATIIRMGIQNLRVRDALAGEMTSSLFHAFALGIRGSVIFWAGVVFLGWGDVFWGAEGRRCWFLNPTIPLPRLRWLGCRARNMAQ
jgi:hypothetical protein